VFFKNILLFEYSCIDVLCIEIYLRIKLSKIKSVWNVYRSMDFSDFEFVICAFKLIAFAIVVAVSESSEVKFCFRRKRFLKAKIYSVGSEDDLYGSFKGLLIIKGRRPN